MSINRKRARRRRRKESRRKKFERQLQHAANLVEFWEGGPAGPYITGVDFGAGEAITLASGITVVGSVTVGGTPVAVRAKDFDELCAIFGAP